MWGIGAVSWGLATKTVATETTPQIYYNSEYRHGVDDKRRLQIPAKWRPADLAMEFTLILWPNAATGKAYVLALPPEPMKALATKLKEMPYSDPKAESLRRLLGKNSDQVTLDKSGRICLPDTMAKAAGIEKDAVLVGSWDRFEIWNPERYAAASVVDDALASEAFKLI